MSIDFSKDKDCLCIAKKIHKCQERGKSKCKRCGGQHGIEISIPTWQSRFCKGVIDLGVFVVVPCHTCHPNYFKRYMHGLKRIRPDLFINTAVGD